MIKWTETVCKCGECGLNITSKFMNVLNDLREDYGKPIVVLSGARCEKHNKSVGGAKSSAHIEGRAADLERTPSLLKFCSESNLEKYDLYMEDLQWTKEWIHLTDRAPPSGKRIFKP